MVPGSKATLCQTPLAGRALPPSLSAAIDPQKSLQVPRALYHAEASAPYGYLEDGPRSEGAPICKITTVQFCGVLALPLTRAYGSLSTSLGPWDTSAV